MKQFDLQGNEYDIQIKEMLDNIPKADGIASSYVGINLENLQKVMERFRKIPDYNELLKENERLHSIIKEVREYIEEMQIWLADFEDFGITTKGLLEILDKEVN